MALTLPSRAGHVLAGTAFFVGVSLLAALLGIVAAWFPLSFSLGLAGLLGLLVIFLMAVFLPSNVRAPGGLLGGMLAVVLVVSALWPGYVTFKYSGAPGISPTRLVYWGMVLLWFFWLTASPMLRRHLFAQLGAFKGYQLLLAIYVIWQIIAATVSPVPFASFYYLVKLLFGGYLFYLIVLSVMHGAHDVQRVIVWVVVAAAMVSLIGMLEGFRKVNLFAGLFPTDPEQLETLQWIILDKTRSGAYRVASTFSHPLAFAEYLTMCLPLAAYLALNGQVRWHKLIGVGALPLMLVGLYLSRTRSALVVAAIVAVTLMLIVGARATAQRKNFFHAIIGTCLIVGVLLAVVGGSGLMTELTVGRDSAERGSTNARVDMMARGSPLVATEPIIGYGPGRAAITLGAQPGHVNISIDNYYLSVALESGLPGLFLFAITLAYPIALGLFRGLTHHTPAGSMALALGAGLLAFAAERGVLSLTNNLDFSIMLTAMLFVTELQIRRERKASGASRKYKLGHATL